LFGGQALAVIGVAITLVLATQVDRSKSMILGATVVLALLNWLWARRTRSAE
jgi:hypothetical protein